MNERILIAGFGGQGVLFTGTVLAGAAMEEGLESTFFPSYGAEMRGGTANSSVVISSEKIGSPVVRKPSSLIIMNEQSFKKFTPLLKARGVLVINSSLVRDGLKRDDIEKIEVPATRLAEDLGDVKTANMIALGAYIRKTGIFSLNSAEKFLKVLLHGKKEALIAINIKALRTGAGYDKKS